MDIEKAFDKVWHEGLLHKMMTMNTPTTLIKITQSFLSNRSFRIRVDDQLSTHRPILAGVPQGSCLSPFLYLIFTNDLPISDQSSVSLFADDTLLYCADKNFRRATIKLQKYLDEVRHLEAKGESRQNYSGTVQQAIHRQHT